MLRWLVGLFRFGSARSVESRQFRPVIEIIQAASMPVVAGNRAAETSEAPPGVIEYPERREFLGCLLAGEARGSIENLGEDDRLFVTAILKRVHENRLEIPLLPSAALRISRLVSEPDSEIRDVVEVLQADPALSIEILRMANSAYYGFVHETSSVREAVVRIGLNRVWGLIVTTNLYGKILHAGVYQKEAGWLSELSLALGQAAEQLAPYLGVAPDDAFTLGVLWHVEHLIMLSVVPEVSREHRRKVRPTYQGLQYAFARFGASVRELAAKRWGLERLLVMGPERLPTVLAFLQVREAVVAAWTGAKVCGEPQGMPAEALDRALRRVTSKRNAVPAPAPLGLPLPVVTA